MRQATRAHKKTPSRSSTRNASHPPKTLDEGKSSNIEIAAAESIKKAGEKGVLQTHLLKKLGMDNRKGSKLVSKLEGQGLIKRSRELYGGKWTYRLTTPRAKPTPVSWGELGCPCFFCNDSGRCGLGNVISPSSCSFLSGWLKSFLAPAAEASQSTRDQITPSVGV